MPQRTDNPIQDQYEQQFNDRVGQLQSAENNTPDSYINSGLDQAQAYANDPANNVREREEAGAPWKDNTGQSEQRKQKIAQKIKDLAVSRFTGGAKVVLQKNSAPLTVIMLIITLLGGSQLFFPVVMIGSIHSIVDKVMGVSDAVQDERANNRFISKVSGSKPASCKIQTYLCRNTTITSDEMKTIKSHGYELRDAKGKALVADSDGLYSGARTIYNTKTNKSTRVSMLKVATLGDDDLRTMINDVYPSRWAVLRDARAAKVKKAKHVVENPKITEGDADTKEKNIAKNLSDAQQNPDVLQGLDTDTFAAVEEEMSSIQDDISNGTTKSSAGNVVDVANLPDPKISLVSKVKSLLKPTSLDIVSGVCSGVNTGRTIVTIAAIAGVTAKIAYGTHIISTVEKVMSNNINIIQSVLSDDLSWIFDRFYTPNAEGATFGDSTSYHLLSYGTPSDTALESGITGGLFLTILIAFLIHANKYEIPGTSISLTDACKALSTNTGQIIATGLAVTAEAAAAFFTGGGSTLASRSAAIGMKAALKELMEKTIKSVTAKLVEKTFNKNALKTISKDLLVSAAASTGFMLIGYLATKFIIPYVAKLATGTASALDINGVAGMDNLIGGLMSLASSLNLSRGLNVMSVNQYMQQDQANFVGEYNKNYIAYQQRTANPLDVTNPYSTLGSITSSLNPLLAKINIIKYPALIRTLPTTLASVVNPFAWTSTASAATSEQRRTLISQCEQQDIDETIATDVFCNPVTGFNDIALLKSATTTDVYNYLHDRGQVDDEGEAVENTDYSKFLSKCVLGSESKSISSLLDSESRLDPECTSEEYNNREDIKYYRLMTIDRSIDQGFNSDSTSSNTDGTITAQLGKLISPIPESEKGVQMTARYYNYPSGGAHWGVDLARDTPWNVVSACDGTVIKVAINNDYANSNAYGVSGSTNYVWVDCGGGVYMGYAHFYAKDLKSYIKEGAKIGAGTVLFPEGNQGNSSGPHLHFQINKGSFNYNQASTYDPTVFMKDRGVTLPAATY